MEMGGLMKSIFLIPLIIFYFDSSSYAFESKTVRQITVTISIPFIEDEELSKVEQDIRKIYQAPDCNVKFEISDPFKITKADWMTNWRYEGWTIINAPLFQM